MGAETIIHLSGEKGAMKTIRVSNCLEKMKDGQKSGTYNPAPKRDRTTAKKKEFVVSEMPSLIANQRRDLLAEARAEAADQRYTSII